MPKSKKAHAHTVRNYKSFSPINNKIKLHRNTLQQHQNNIPLSSEPHTGNKRMAQDRELLL